jgi:hypothetical protein
MPLTSGVPEWLTSIPMLLALAIATVVEIGAYYIPWLDNVLDVIASPAAVGAGVLLSAAILADLDPGWRWGLAVVAGGGTAGTTQASTVALRALSSMSTGGLTSFLLSTGEWFGAMTLAILALMLAPLAALLVLVMMVVGVRVILRWREKRAQQPTARSES